MKPLLFTALALALGVGQSLSTDYTRERSLTTTVKVTSETTVTANEVTVDGEPMDRGGFGGGGRSSEFSYSFTDSVLAHKDGAPTKVKRAYGDVGGSTTMPGRDGDTEIDLESAFSDAIVVIDTTGEEKSVEVVEGKLEDEQVAGLVPTMTLDRLLPEGEVEAGATWELEGADVLAAVGSDLERQLFRRAAPEGGGEGQGGRGGRGPGGRGFGGAGSGLAQLANGEWDAKAKLTEETEEVDGVTCAVITLEVEASGELPEMGGGGGRGRDRAFGLTEAPRANTFEAKLAGRLLWSTSEARAVRLTLAGTVETVTDTERETERGVMKMHREQEQKVDIQIDVTAGAKAE